jgi:hypothetical protein
MHLAERRDLRAEDIEIDVGRGQHDLHDLGGDATVPDGHLPQGFERHPVPHRMGKDNDLADRRIFRERAQNRLQRIARIIRALAIVGIGEKPSARRPGEQHGQGGRAGIMRDLRKTVDRLLEAVVVAVHEQQNTAAGQFREPPVEPADRAFRIHPVGADRDEVMRGIAGQAARPLHIANAARGVRRNGNRDIGEGQAAAALAREHFTGRRAFSPACRRNQHIDTARARRRLKGFGGSQKARRTAGATRKREGDRKRRECEAGRQGNRARKTHERHRETTCRMHGPGAVAYENAFARRRRCQVVGRCILRDTVRADDRNGFRRYRSFTETAGDQAKVRSASQCNDFALYIRRNLV